MITAGKRQTVTKQVAFIMLEVDVTLVYRISRIRVWKDCGELQFMKNRFFVRGIAMIQRYDLPLCTTSQESLSSSPSPSFTHFLLDPNL